MTLLLATATEWDILVTADGLSCATGLRDAPGRATLQKIFPVPSRAVAIAQCGPNFLKVARGKISLKQWLDELFEKLDTGNVASIAQYVCESIRCDEVEAEEENKFFNKKACLWVMGFSTGCSRPEFLCIDKGGIRGLLGPEGLPFTTYIGAGADFVKECEWGNHDDAWHHALKRQGEKQAKPVFGGHLHRLRITPARCEWATSREPMRGTLGLETFLSRWLDGSTLDGPGGATAPGADSSDPRGKIVSLHRMLVDELCHRALIEQNHKHPGRYGGAIEHWKCDRKPNWDLTDQLIAAFDDMELADSTDVSPNDARVYEVLVHQVIESLPPKVT